MKHPRSSGPAVRSPVLFHRRGHTAAIAVTVAASLAAATFGVLGTANLMNMKLAVSTASQRPTVILPLTRQELRGVLGRAGLDPEALTAAGVAPESIAALVGQARLYLVDHIQDFRDAEADYVAAKQEVDRLERAVTGGASDEVSALANARSTLDTAGSARRAVLDGTFSAAASGLSEGQVLALTRIKAGRAARWGLPAAYLAGARSEPEQVALRNALANERVSSQLGREPDAADQQILTLARADTAVSAAMTALASSQDAVTAAWLAAATE